MSARTVWGAFTASVAHDNASPRVTFYERTPGPTNGERIELSGKVLLNWVSKAANMLSEEFDIAPGSVVALHLPACHWRTQYWALAAWACGAQVAFTDCEHGESPADGDVLVTCCPQPDVTDQIVVTLAALSRTASESIPARAFDEAKELPTYSDLFAPLVIPEASDVAFTSAAGSVTFAEMLASNQPQRAYLPDPLPTDVLAHLISDSGVVIVRGEGDVTGILTQEGLRS